LYFELKDLNLRMDTSRQKVRKIFTYLLSLRKVCFHLDRKLANFVQY
jgi:hypothetical protein